MIKKFLSFFVPQKIASFTSPVNGTIEVIEFLGRRSIEVESLTQSGAMLERLFRDGIKRFGLNKNPKQMDKILILGLGGGSLVKILRHYFPDTPIHGIDIDPVMVTIGKKYFGLDDYPHLTVTIADVFKPTTKFGKDYDLIIVDLFKGYTVSEIVDDEVFFKKIKSSLRKNGCVIFNRLYFRNYIFEADLFLDKLKKIFQDVITERTRFNILIKVQ